ncbi:hypothetical protein BOX15_Mlig027732g1 [Macrostomum lignano]|uniref:Small integral membrane protein 15 n=2 Tax=Macrostomum lignano TaxID=282301 RepID=A0A1I8I2G0_9PLAT|nr:hypothetical protein BOX15_Mlig027732g1 [Macrostomum lignano]
MEFYYYLAFLVPVLVMGLITHRILKSYKDKEAARLMKKKKREEKRDARDSKKPKLAIS